MTYGDMKFSTLTRHWPFRLQLRFLLPLVLVLVVAANLAVPLMDQVTLRWFSRDLNSRGMLVANALSDSVSEALLAGRTAKLQPLFERALQDERLFAIGLCNERDELLQRTEAFPSLTCAAAAALSRQAEPRLSLAGGPVHVGVHEVMGTPALPQPPSAAPVPENFVGPPAPVSPPPVVSVPPQPVLVGHLVLLHDMSFIDRRSQDTRHYLV
ncbi:MAG: hypothetical protein EOP39_15265, partial [Rubrivivax sp.]